MKLYFSLLVLLGGVSVTATYAEESRDYETVTFTRKTVQKISEVLANEILHFVDFLKTEEHRIKTHEVKLSDLGKDIRERVNQFTDFIGQIKTVAENKNVPILSEVSEILDAKLHKSHDPARQVRSTVARKQRSKRLLSSLGNFLGEVVNTIGDITCDLGETVKHLGDNIKA